MLTITTPKKEELVSTVLIAQDINTESGFTTSLLLLRAKLYCHCERSFIVIASEALLSLRAKLYCYCEPSCIVIASQAVLSLRAKRSNRLVSAIASVCFVPQIASGLVCFTTFATPQISLLHYVGNSSDCFVPRNCATLDAIKLDALRLTRNDGLLLIKGIKSAIASTGSGL